MKIFLLLLFPVVFPDLALAGSCRGVKFHYPANCTLGSDFGPRRSPTPGASTDHKGQDFRCNSNTTIKAVADGTITFAGRAGSAGKMIIIDHANGLQSRYLHLKSYLKTSGRVTAGTPIAKSNNTGVSSGAHLHLDIICNGVFKNPMNYLRSSAAETDLNVDPQLNGLEQGVVL